MWSSSRHTQKTTTSSFEHFSDAWTADTRTAEADAGIRNMNFMELFIRPINQKGRECNAQTCTLGEHTLFDTYCSYPLRTPWLSEIKHSVFDPFELVDGDSELLACLAQVQLAANIKGRTTHSLTHDTSDLPYLNIVSNHAGGREPACRADKRASLAVPHTSCGKQAKSPD